jgi:hypothetical protein
MEAGADMKKALQLTREQQARYKALSQEEKDKIEADVHREGQELARAAELKKAYNLDPELWRSKNLSGVAALMLVNAGTTDPITQETFMANYRGKIRELGRETDSALERSLVEYAALCWLRLQWVDMAYSQKSNRGGDIENLDYWDRHLSAAQRRFDKACLDLAKVRRLALPVVQLNIGDKQINVAQVNRVDRDTREEGNGHRDEC